MDKKANGSGAWWPGMLIGVGILMGFFIAQVSVGNSKQEAFINGQYVGIQSSLQAQKEGSVIDGILYVPIIPMQEQQNIGFVFKSNTDIEQCKLAFENGLLECSVPIKIS